ncbi:hypothetical protein EK904_002630 [Melospiza melodia maxima]|nr:hypothetical protein EK904_002630 [Melospiza melodia maxima]
MIYVKTVALKYQIHSPFKRILKLPVANVQLGKPSSTPTQAINEHGDVMLSTEKLEKIKLMKIFSLTPVSLKTFCFEMIKILPEHEFLPSQALFGQPEELFKLKDPGDCRAVPIKKVNKKRPYDKQDKPGFYTEDQSCTNPSFSATHTLWFHSEFSLSNEKLSAVTEPWTLASLGKSVMCRIPVSSPGSTLRRSQASTESCLVGQSA